MVPSTIRIPRLFKFGLRDLLFLVSIMACHLGMYLKFVGMIAPDVKPRIITLVTSFCAIALAIGFMDRRDAITKLERIFFLIPSSIQWWPICSTSAISFLILFSLMTLDAEWAEPLFPISVFTALMCFKLIGSSTIYLGCNGAILPFYGFRRWSDLDVRLQEGAHARLNVRIAYSKHCISAEIPSAYVAQIRAYLEQFTPKEKRARRIQPRKENRKQKEGQGEIVAL